MRADKSPAESVWSRRLDGGPNFSCTPDWGPGQALEGFWRQVFASARPGARVLELGCGSGEVSLWAAEAGRGLKITASDVHDNAAAVRRHPDVTFLGGAPAQKLPLPDEAFDMVIANFAIEYAPLDGAADELARVLAPRGGAVLVTHRADSTITQTSRIALATHAAVVAAGVPDRVRRAAALRADHLTRRKLLKDVLKLRADIPAPALSYSGVEYFDLAERLLKGDPAARADLIALEGSVAMRFDISREQSAVALDAAALGRFSGMLSGRGLSVDTSELTCTYDGGATDKVGWIVMADKPAR